MTIDELKEAYIELYTTMDPDNEAQQDELQMLGDKFSEFMTSDEFMNFMEDVAAEF